MFSYHLAPPGSPEGVFRAYFRLFAERQTAIGKACRQWPSDIVLYADIKSFYPSVTPGRAKRAWQAACKKAGLESRWQRMGEHLLESSRTVEEGLLVGPMFSHVVGNLLLLEFDRRMRRRYADRFFRYVDDIALVIPLDEKQRALDLIRELLRPLGLRLNRKKIHHLSTVEWRTGAPHQRVDYEGMDDRSDDRWWMHFIDQVKCYLMAHPQKEEELARAFRDEGIRIALPRYRSAIQDAGYVGRFQRRLALPQFKQFVTGLNVRQLVCEARDVGKLYRRDFGEIWQAFQEADGMRRKWLVSQLMYLLGRLVLLAPENELAGLAKILEPSRELAEFHATFESLDKRDVSNLVRFSGKVCAAAGQALATSRRPVRCAPEQWNEASVEGYVTLLVFGTNLHPQAFTRAASSTGASFCMSFGLVASTKASRKRGNGRLPPASESNANTRLAA